MMEPERKIEKLLRAYARKRRADSGDALKMHPATRRMLHGEVLRQSQKPAPEEASVSLWQLFRRQWALLAGFAVIIFLGATLLMPALSSAKREAKSVGAMSNLRQIGAAAQIAASENNGKLPPSLNVLTNEFVTERTLIDPVSGKPFVYTAGGENLDELQSNSVLAYSSPGKNGGAVLFADGHVQYVARTQLADLTNQKSIQFALADKVARNDVAASRPAAAMPPQTPPAEMGRRQFDTAALSIAQTRAASQEPLFRNDAASAQTAPVLQSFHVLQNGESVSVVDQDGSVYKGSVQIAAAPAQNPPASAGTLEGAASRRPPTAELKPAADQQQVAQNYSFRVTGINRTLKKDVVFSGNMETLPGVSTNTQQNAGMSGGIGGGVGGGAQGNFQVSPNQQQGLLSGSRITGTAVVGRTNRIEVNAVPTQ